MQRGWSQWCCKADGDDRKHLVTISYYDVTDYIIIDCKWRSKMVWWKVLHSEGKIYCVQIKSFDACIRQRARCFEMAKMNECFYCVMKSHLKASVWTTWCLALYGCAGRNNKKTLTNTCNWLRRSYVMLVKTKWSNKLTHCKLCLMRIKCVMLSAYIECIYFESLVPRNFAKFVAKLLDVPLAYGGLLQIGNLKTFTLLRGPWKKNIIFCETWFYMSFKMRVT